MRKKYISRIIFATLLSANMMFSFVGCTVKNNTQNSSTGADTVTAELRQSDYRGGVMRTLSLQDSVISVMEEMKSNNVTIRQTSPNSFWTTDGYQDFVSTFLDVDIINDTQWFNEEEVPWKDTVAYMAGLDSSFASGGKFLTGVSVKRNEKDDYSVKGVPKTYQTEGTAISADGDEYSYSCSENGTANYRILYDCDKDWCKSYATMVIGKTNLPATTIELFEYRRVDDNTFAIQTNRERLLVILEEVEADTDIRNRKVKEFYYSKIVSDGRRTTYKPYEFLPEQDYRTGMKLASNIEKNKVMTDYPFVNESGDLCNSYGESDSMFFNASDQMDQSWVFEDKSLQQAIVYNDGALVVTTYNKLSANYERFVYARVDVEESRITELENMVEINNLVGVQDTEITVAPDKKVEVPPANNAVSGTVTGTTGTGSYQTTTSVSVTGQIPSETTQSTEEFIVVTTVPMHEAISPQTEG